MEIGPLEAAVRIGKSLGHPTRLRIVALLQRGPLCVCQLTAVIRAAASTISAHLTELRRAGVVLESKQGKWVEYRLQDDDAIREVLAPLLAVTRGDAALRADRTRLADVAAIPAIVLCEADLDVERARRAFKRRRRASLPPAPGRDAPSRPTKRHP
jgi:ArsR family transcriptional regulator, arsenate/arsenite/antimonite-responsive transcriptional repressor